MWMKSRPSQPVRLRLVNIPSGSKRDSVLFKDVMPASSVDILLKDINVAANVQAFSRFVLRNFASIQWFEDADKMIGESFFFALHRVDRTVPYFRWQPRLVNSGRRPIYAMRVESWELRIEREREQKLLSVRYNELKVESNKVRDESWVY